MSSQTDQSELSLHSFADPSLFARLRKGGAEEKLDLSAPCFWLGSVSASVIAETTRLLTAVEAENLPEVQSMTHLAPGPAVYALLFRRKESVNKYDVLVFKQPTSFTGLQECLLWKRLQREYVVCPEIDTAARIGTRVSVRWWHVLLGVFCPKAAARLIVPDLPCDAPPSLRR